MRILLPLLLCVTTLATSAAADITTGLVAYWPFSQGPQDASGNGNHGTVMGAALTTDRMGNQASAYVFDGVSSRIDVPNSASLASPTSAITVAAWVRRDGWGMVGSGYSPILTKSISTPNAFQYRWITGTGGMSIAFNSWNESTGIAYDFADTTWYHIAMTWEADTARSYVNGVLQGTTHLPVTIVPDTRTLSIGSDVPGILEIYKGKIDELRIYSRRLDDADVAELHGETVSVPAPGASLRGATLGNAYPNPLQPSTVIPMTLSKDMAVSLEVVDVSGRRVRTLLRRQELSAGLHSIRWSGIDDAGRRLDSGVYFYRLLTPEGAVARKIFVQR